MSGGNKKRKDIATGVEKSNQFSQQASDAVNTATQNAVQTQNPYANAGVPAIGGLSALGGYALEGGPTQEQAYANFTNSPFYTGGETAFNQDLDKIDSSLSNSGLLFSSARLNAKEDARNKNFQNAFSQYLGNLGGLANSGQQAAGTQANAFINQGAQNANIATGQGSTAFNAGLQSANTRQGVLGTIGQIANIGANVAGAATGFSDRRLKTDVRDTGLNVGPFHLYSWRWNDEAKTLGIQDGEAMGFMADEVEAVMPEMVSMARGYKTVDYGAIIERL